MQLVSKIFNLCGHDPRHRRTDGRTDGRTCDSKSTLCTVMHHAVKNSLSIVLMTMDQKHHAINIMDNLFLYLFIRLEFNVG